MLPKLITIKDIIATKVPPHTHTPTPTHTHFRHTTEGDLFLVIKQEMGMEVSEAVLIHGNFCSLVKTLF